MKRENPEFLTQQEVFAAHAEFGRLDKDMVKEGMKDNWPREWDFRHPDIFERAPSKKGERV